MVGTLKQSESCAEECGGAQRCTHRCAWSPLLYILGYHWLPLATIDLVGDNREFDI